MKAVENLIKAPKDKKIGNHRKEIAGNTTQYIYHWTPIVTVNEDERTFTTDNGGYGTRSTTCAINDYRRKLSAIGYKCLN